MPLKIYRHNGGIFQFDDKDVPKGAEPYAPKAATAKRATKTKAPATAKKVTEDQTK